jgi:hypothetical protein
MLQQPVHVLYLNFLGIGVWVVGNTGRRVTSVAIGDDLVAAGEEIYLGLLTGDVSGEFMAQHHRIALAGYLVVNVNAVGRESGHVQHSGLILA